MERRLKRSTSCAVAALACIGFSAQALAQDVTPSVKNPGGQGIPVLSDIPIIGQLFRTGAPPASVNNQPYFYAPPTPELAKKTVAIMALRGINSLQLSAKDITAALPPLKELRDAEKSLHKLADQALDDEKRALLAVQPGDNPPADSGEKMRQEADRYGAVRVKVWDNLAAAIGPEKAGGLFGLLGMTSRSNRFNDFFVPPTGSSNRNFDPFNGRGPQPQLKPESAPVRFEITPQTTAIEPVVDRVPAAPQPETIGILSREPQALPDATPVPATGANPPIVALPTPQDPARQSGAGATPAIPPGGVDFFQDHGNKPRGGVNVRTDPRPDQYIPPDPNNTSVFPVPQPGQYKPSTNPGGYYPSVRISISELVDLLEQKLGAMRK
jgi:hypothetical protein